MPKLGSARALVLALEKDLRAAGTAKRAEGSKAYLKSELDFAGVDVPTLRRAVKELLASRPELDRAQLLALARALWARPVFELRAAAAELLAARAALLTPHDLPFLERLLRAAKTWALIDSLAPQVVGPLHVRAPRAVGPVLDRWARDPDFWVQRSALLVHLEPLRRGEGDWERFGRHADALLESREFFVRKAIGWVLRERSKRKRREVFEWMLPRAQRMSGLTLREGSKYLAAGERARLFDARTSSS